AMPVSGPGSELQLRSMMPAPTRTVEDIERLGAEAGLQVSWRGRADGGRDQKVGHGQQLLEGRDLSHRGAPR
ncbi:hypothetical protein KBX53_03020, partial [Micromonospora sp. M51]|uniref:hypothetical protein n=1 Tax=Micromonospora sp. M51 TaxID=2824889 RepID=UPI001B382E91